MNFNTFSALYGVTIATSSFSGSGYTGSLVQAAQDLNYTLTIITGSSVGDPLQVTSSFGSLISHSFTTSSFNERTSSVAISDATPFQSILVQGTVQGVNATTPVVFSSPISSSHISASGVISASGNIFGTNLYAQGGQVYTSNTQSLRNASNGLLVGAAPQFQSVTLGRAGKSVNIPAPITSSAVISSSAEISSTTITIDGTSKSEGNRLFEIKGNEGGVRVYYDSQQRLQLGNTEAVVSLHANSVQITGSTTSNSSLTISSDQINFTNLPTSDPGVAGRLYRDGGTVKVSI